MVSDEILDLQEAIVNGRIVECISLNGVMHSDVTLIGRLSPTQAILTGRIFIPVLAEESSCDIESLSGAIQSDAVLIGVISTSQPMLRGNVAIPVGYDEFKGSYEVTPKISDQALKTKDKLMYKDLIIKGIPYYEVSNSKGGITIIIGG